MQSLRRSALRARHFLGAFAALLLSAFAARASAQDAGATGHVGANVKIGLYTRSISARPTSQFPTYISYADCVDGDVITYPVTLGNLTPSAPGGAPIGLQVWMSESGYDCSVGVNRNPLPTTPTTATGYCTQIGTKNFGYGTNTNGIVIVNLPASEIANHVYGVANCIDTGQTTATLPHPTVLYFVLVRQTTQGTDIPSADFSVSNVNQVDLLGPNPPAGITAGIGDGFLVMNYDTSNQGSDFLSYGFFCDPPPSGSPYTFTVDAGSPDGGSAGGGGTGGGATGGGGAAGGGAAGGGAAAVTSASTSSGSSNPAQCPASPTSNVLIPGQVPDARIPSCGTSQGNSGATVDLVNNVAYTVGIVGYDLIGNAGVMSPLTCATPQPVDDFFKLYRLAGGKAGGGYCSVDAVGAGTTMFGAVAFGVAFGLAVRRRRQRSARRGQR